MRETAFRRKEQRRQQTQWYRRPDYTTVFGAGLFVGIFLGAVLALVFS